MVSVKKLLEDKVQSNIWNVQPQQTVIEALELMAEKNIGAVMVMEDDKLVGIFSERDYARKGIIMGRNAKTTIIADVMTPKVFTVSSSMNVHDCMQIFSDKKFRHLPVVDNGQVVGILSVGDIVNSIMQEQKQHISYLESYISQA
jgi:CBS domain-containing protein